MHKEKNKKKKSYCDGFHYFLSISKYDGLFTNNNNNNNNNQMQIENYGDFLIETLRANIKVIDKASRWDLLLSKEDLRIKELSPLLNSGVT